MASENALAPLSAEAMTAYQQAIPEILREIVARCLTRRQEVAHHGDEAGRLIASGMDFTARMLESAMRAGTVLLLEDQLRWAMDRLPHDGVAPEHMVSRLRCMAQVIDETLSPEHARAVNAYLAWMVARAEELMAEQG